MKLYLWPVTGPTIASSHCHPTRMVQPSPWLPAFLPLTPVSSAKSPSLGIWGRKIYFSPYSSALVLRR